MTNTIYNVINPDTMVCAKAFTIDLYRYTTDDGKYYNPVIGFILDIGDSKESRFFISTEIYDKDLYRAIYYATQIAVIFTSKYHDEVNMVNEDGEICSEKFSINSTMKNFKLLMQHTEENFSIH